MSPTNPLKDLMRRFAGLRSGWPEAGREAEPDIVRGSGPDGFHDTEQGSGHGNAQGRVPDEALPDDAAAVPSPVVPWPPRHDVRTSPRARRVRLRIVPRRGLEVVIPPGFSATRIPEVLERHRTWIVRALLRAGLAEPVPGPACGSDGGEGGPGNGQGFQPGAGAFLGPDGIRSVPAEVVLPAVQARYGVIRAPLAPGMRPELREVDAALRLRVPEGGAGDGVAVDLLRDWLRAVARRRLAPWLHALAVEHGFHYQRCVVRMQQTRWGSCSARGTISCNASLLFLPRELARHVLLHELCHTVHLDHSSRFHALLDRVDPDAALWREGLRSGWSHVPWWAR